MRLNITAEFAKKDDCLDRMIPADLRSLVSERDAALRERDALRGAAQGIEEFIKDHALWSSDMGEGVITVDDLRAFLAASKGE